MTPATPAAAVPSGKTVPKARPKSVSETMPEAVTKAMVKMVEALHEEFFSELDPSVFERSEAVHA